MPNDTIGLPWHESLTFLILTSIEDHFNAILGNGVGSIIVRKLIEPTLEEGDFFAWGIVLSRKDQSEAVDSYTLKFRDHHVHTFECMFFPESVTNVKPLNMCLESGQLTLSYTIERFNQECIAFYNMYFAPHPQCLMEECCEAGTWGGQRRLATPGVLTHDQPLQRLPDSTVCLFSPDESMLACCVGNGAIYVWEIGTGKILHIVHARAQDISWCAESRKIVFLDYAHDISIYRLEQRDVIQCTDCFGDASAVVCSPAEAGKIAVVLSNTIEVITTEGDTLHSFKTSDGGKKIEVKWSPDGKLIAYFAGNKFIQFFSLDDKKFYIKWNRKADEFTWLTGSEDYKFALVYKDKCSFHKLDGKVHRIGIKNDPMCVEARLAKNANRKWGFRKVSPGGSYMMFYEDEARNSWLCATAEPCDLNEKKPFRRVGHQVHEPDETFTIYSPSGELIAWQRFSNDKQIVITDKMGFVVGESQCRDGASLTVFNTLEGAKKQRAAFWFLQT